MLSVDTCVDFPQVHVIDGIFRRFCSVSVRYPCSMKINRKSQPGRTGRCKVFPHYPLTVTQISEFAIPRLGYGAGG